MRRLCSLLVIVSLLTAGSVGVVAGETAASATPDATISTPTVTPSESTAPSAANNTSDTRQSRSEQASLYIEQPRHVTTPVRTTSDDSGITYTVSGEVLEIEPQNFTADSVVDASVREGSATLRFDDGIGRWLLDTQGVSGTYQLRFRTRVDGDYTTYSATINVEQAEYAHLQPSRLDGMRDEADHWEWTVDQFHAAGLVSGNADVDQVKSVIEDAVTWYKFYDNPLSGLSGQFLTFAIMLVKWPAGWIILGSIAILAFWRVGATKKENRKLKRQFADIENIDESKREAQERELKRILSMKTFQDLGLTETDAQAVKEHCGVDNPRQFLDQFTGFFSETQAVGLLLSAYDQLDHTISVSRREGEVIDAELVAHSPMADGGESVTAGDDLSEMEGHIRPQEADDDIIDALDWTELSPDVLWHDDVDASTLDLPINNDAESEGEDLIDEFGIPIGEDGHQYHVIERRGEFADILVQIIRGIASSDFTDDEGRVRPDADLLDFLYTFTAVGAEQYRFSLWHMRDILLRSRQMLDAGERMSDLAIRSQNNQLSERTKQTERGEES